MTWKGLALAGAALLLGACASGSSMVPFAGSGDKPAPASQTLLGAWSCQRSDGGLTKQRTVTYQTGGQASFTFNITGNRDGVAHDFAGNARETWEVLPDGRLDEKLVTFSVTRAKMGGRDVVSALMQGMVEEMLAQRAPPLVEINGASMALNYGDSSGATCLRQSSDGALARAF
jgi:hypothetical protein